MATSKDESLRKYQVYMAGIAERTERYEGILAPLIVHDESYTNALALPTDIIKHMKDISLYIIC